MARRSSKITQGLWPQWPAAVLVRTEDLQKLTYEFLYSFRLYVCIYIYIYYMYILRHLIYIYILQMGTIRGYSIHTSRCISRD